MSTLKVNAIVDASGGDTSTINSGTPVSTTSTQVAKAWVNFNGTGTVAIRAQYNVASITDDGTGTYTLNFTTALSDADYAVVGACGATSASTGGGNYSLGIPGVSSIYTTTQVKVQTYTTNNNISDTFFIGVAIFR